ncbi:hypothetical protein [Streptomyces sp. NPDC054783]
MTQAAGPMNAEFGQLRRLREEVVARQRQNEAAHESPDRWNALGIRECMVQTLMECVAIPAVPVLEPSKEPPLPDMLVEGVVDPRLFHTDDDNDRDGETRGGTVASRTTKIWQAVMTVSAIPGCPSRRATPGSGSWSS